MKSSTADLIGALEILSRTITAPDDVPATVLAEASERMEELMFRVHKLEGELAALKAKR